MAKDKDKNKKADKADTKGKEKAEKAEAPTFEFGVDELAEALDIKPASVRVQLRNKGIEKAGKTYGWNSKKEYEEVLAQLKKAEKSEKSDKKAKDGKKKKDKDKKSKKDD